MSDGPYRNNLESRVSNLEQEVETLKGSAVDKGPSVKKAFKGQIVTLLNDGSLAGGSFIAILLAIVCFSFPSCVRSCSDTPEQVRAAEEARQAVIAQHRQACEDIQMHYVGYDSRLERLTCANERIVLTIDINDGESWSVPVDHQREE